MANAAAFLAVSEERGSFDDYLWEFVDGTPGGQPLALPRRRAGDHAAVRGGQRRPATARDFASWAPPSCYAHLQAAGLVVDHLTDCFRYRELAG